MMFFGLSLKFKSVKSTQTKWALKQLVPTEKLGLSKLFRRPFISPNFITARGTKKSSTLKTGDVVVRKRFRLGFVFFANQTGFACHGMYWERDAITHANQIINSFHHKHFQNSNS